MKSSQDHVWLNKPCNYSRLARYVMATACILLSVIAWIMLTDALQRIQVKYHKPFFLTYVIHSAYLAVTPVSCTLWALRSVKHPISKYLGSLKFSKHMFVKVTILSVVLFISAWFWFVSVPITSVSGNAAITQSTSSVILLLSCVILKEKITIRKVVAVILSMTGVFLVVFLGSRNANDPTASLSIQSHPSSLGYFLALASMILFCFFEVLCKKFISGPDGQSVCDLIHVFTLMGYITLLTFFPCFFILHFTGLETFEYVQSSDIGPLAILVSLDLAYNFLIIAAIYISTPLFTSVSCVLVLPASMLWDWIQYHYELPSGGIIGTVFIAASYLVYLSTAISKKSSRRGYKKVQDAVDQQFDELRVHPKSKFEKTRSDSETVTEDTDGESDSGESTSALPHVYGRQGLTEVHSEIEIEFPSSEVFELKGDK